MPHAAWLNSGDCYQGRYLPVRHRRVQGCGQLPDGCFHEYYYRRSWPVFGQFHERQKGRMELHYPGRVECGHGVPGLTGTTGPAWLPAERADDHTQLPLGERRVEHGGRLGEGERDIGHP